MHPTDLTDQLTQDEGRAQLRRALRARRRALSARERRLAGEAAARRFAQHSLFLRSRRIAFYLAHEGEMDPAPLMARAWAMGKRVYLPVLRPLGANRLWFTPYRPGDRLVANRFGIEEPPARLASAVPPWGLDLVLAPLVGFDRQGGRLGMGGGFYDRTLAYLLQRHHWRRPLLAGLAYEFQEVPALPRQPWDVPLAAVVTEQGARLF
ncbi:5-formyltetrahydrofolate cyclo-ligase [Ectothiorhodospiraceae bacterium 2226]|nr:5-formyltetrahydrofolate cyclo-ligase [Ectothiorhodospiraceae bacterium 2226]